MIPRCLGFNIIHYGIFSSTSVGPERFLLKLNNAGWCLQEFETNQSLLCNHLVLGTITQKTPPRFGITTYGLCFRGINPSIKPRHAAFHKKSIAA